MAYTDIFPFMKEIFFHKDIEEFKEEVDRNRREMLAADRALMMKVKTLNLDKCHCIPEGRVTTVYQDIPFELFIKPRKAGPLYVFLNGTKNNIYPEFARWTYYSFLSGSMLNIADPMYGKYEDLQLGWYYGDGGLDLRQVVAGLVEKIADILGIDRGDIIFWGSSGGGAAVFEISSLIPTSKAVAINPQIKLQEYTYAESFSRITGNNLYEDKWNRHNGLYYLKNNQDNFWILIINLRSTADMVQLGHICEEMHLKVQYGINLFRNMIIWVYDADMEPYKGTHSTQEFYCIVFAVEYLLRHIKNSKTLENCRELFLLMNEFWHYRYKVEKELRDRMPDLETLYLCTTSSKKVSLWGAGGLADTLSKELMDIDGKNYYHVENIFDVDERKWGKFFKGIPVKNPYEVLDWHLLFVIITNGEAEEEIALWLESQGLKRGEDFISHKDLYRKK